MSNPVVAASSSSSTIPTYSAERIARFRLRLDEARTQFRKQADAGVLGVQNAAFISDAYDAILLEILADALETLSEIDRVQVAAHSTLIAVGGYGRGELAPFSDLDLLFLHRPKIAQAHHEFASRIVRDCWDAGLKLGHSVRTVDDALAMARSDIQFGTSLVEARRLWGSEDLFRRLGDSFQKTVARGRSPFIRKSIEARIQERQQHGATTQQLEPDVKRSLGGLRDVHLLRWIAFAQFGVVRIDELRRCDALPKDDARQLTDAHDFLLKVRCELHLTAGRPQDVLTREDQLRIAERWTYPGTEGQLPVEQFMQTYFRHASSIADVTRRFAARARSPSWVDVAVRSFFNCRVDDIYYIGPDQIDVARSQRQRICSRLESVLELYLAARRYQVRLAPPLIELIKQQRFPSPDVLSESARSTFLSILDAPGTLGATLRSMHETGVLEAVLPQLKHMRCLLQFNQYHSFTVDEHTLRAIEAAEAFERDPGPVGRAYRAIRHKELLHVAILLHDAAKGFKEDHCILGARWAVDASHRLGLRDHERELIEFLVRRHLEMADLAFRRDLSDPALLMGFNHVVGSPDALRLLYVLTAADISAVGPAVWNQWKAELLTTLYDRAMDSLNGVSLPAQEDARLKQVEANVLQLAAHGSDPAQRQLLKQLLRTFPPHYLLGAPAEQIAVDLKFVQRLDPLGVEVAADFDPETSTVMVRVVTHERVASGCFHKISGALTAKRTEILSAQICTSADGVILDTYRVRDLDNADEFPEFRADEIASAIRKVLLGEKTVEELMPVRKKYLATGVQGPVSNLPLRVVIDNQSSDRCTILDVFAHDRPGLLYTVTKAIYALKLSVVLAKISTHFDQVVDVFYVVDQSGAKIRDGQRLIAIKESLVAALTEFERQATS